MKYHEFVSFLFSLFIICSPFVAVPVLLKLMQGRSVKDKKRVGGLAASAVASILVLSAWFGAPLLSSCKIRVEAFQVAGGVIVFLLALSMLGEKVSVHAEAKNSIAIVPLAIPVMAGPGTISQIIIATCDFPGLENRLIITGGVLLVSLLLFIVLYFAVSLERFLGSSGLNVIGRLGGLVLAAVAVETIAKGLIGLFPILA
jgi:multiple antibiotic resistance protein